MDYARKGLAIMPEILMHSVDIIQVGAEVVQEGEGLTAALKKITPSLIILGIAGGAAMALGSGAVHRYVWKKGT